VKIYSILWNEMGFESMDDTNAMTNLVVSANSPHQILMTDNGLHALLGFRADEAVGRSMRFLFGPKTNAPALLSPLASFSPLPSTLYYTPVMAVPDPSQPTSSPSLVLALKIQPWQAASSPCSFWAQITASKLCQRSTRLQFQAPCRALRGLMNPWTPLTTR
jgi:hypothetical protein